MIDLDLKNKNQLYQLIVGITGFSFIFAVCMIIMKPFFPAILISTIFTLSTWPAFTWLTDKLEGRVTLASIMMTLVLAAFFILPIFVIGNSFGENFTKAYHFTQEAIQSSDSQNFVEELKTVPYIGKYLDSSREFFEEHKDQISTTLKKYAAPTSQKLIHLGANVGRGLLDISLGVLLAYFFFRHGSDAAARLARLIDKFAGYRGKQILNISKLTLISVIYGILGTALAQALLAVIGFWIAGVPGAVLLAVFTFFLALIPMGPPLVWIPASVWLYYNGHVGMSIFLALWGLLVISAVDNFLKPYFISVGSNLPIALVLFGVLGGVIAFGFIGIFVGPTFLAIAYKLIIEWSTLREKQNETK